LEASKVGPRIQEATIVEQRKMRQRQLMDAALSLAIEGGIDSVTVSAVAKKAGLSRSSIYEYFASSADLIADLIMEEMAYYNQRLLNAVNDVEDPYKYIELWIAEALQYVVDGRHLLVKSLNSVSTPNFRKSDIAQGHKQLMATITKPLSTIGLDDLTLGLTYLQSTIDAASVRIESGNEPAPEILYAQKYALAGLRALVELSRKD
jgi:AcrR family transcriptional regulator